MMKKEELGPWGEEKAKNYLLKKGYVLVDRNIRYKRYEVDIVMEKNNLLVIDVYVFFSRNSSTVLKNLSNIGSVNP